jgi:hypothetical protein
MLLAALVAVALIFDFLRAALVFQAVASAAALIVWAPSWA